ncbi:Holliday junction branch migration protein RuvA [Candidatus Mycalebacterium sp.]
MISLLKGTVVKKSPELTVIETAGGVGYGVAVSARTLGDLPSGTGGEVMLIIHTHFSVNSREGGLELFGFSEPYEAEIFKKLIGISGIGPRAALKILAAISAEEIADAVVKGDLDKKKIPGLGAKRAATIMNELKDKVSSPATSQGSSADRAAVGNIVSALKNYGFRTSEINAAMKEIEKIAKSTERIEDAVKLTLSIMKK